MLDITRCRFTITGQVQGVGFRPFIYRTALEHELTGNVRNAPEGVVIEIQGTTKAAEAFASALAHKLPPLARIVSQQREDMAPVEDEKVFEILHSTSGKGHSVLISPDIATCPDCLEEILQPQDRRYRYPFTNCTNCGPRYTITRSIPYDRPVTSMSCFPMCPECQAEYDNPLDRRFHAQPNACPVCGPQVWLSGPDGARLSEGATALESLAGRLAAGEIAAIKGLGGFHLACDARNEAAVSELRRRKNRPAKPLAVMVPNVDATRGLALISEPEAEWLNGMFRPIVLCAKRPGQQLAPSIAPDTNFIGLMLPYTPLHHVLLALLAQTTNAEPPALVMTSGNLSSEPICLGNREALARLPEICDVFCFHNRDILIRTDDSVLRVNPRTGDPIFLRRARGFTPSPIFLAQGLAADTTDAPTVLGLGPELKCTLTLTKGDQAFPSQHLGDMQNLETLAFHREITGHLMGILQVEPELIVHDLHPDYMTTSLAAEAADTLAEGKTLPKTALQHHYAHIHAVLAENRHQGSAIGIALDGTGYGTDGTIWGGEILLVDTQTLEHQRLAHLDTFALPGGEMAVREPWRIAFGLLHDLKMDGASGPWPWLPEFEPAAAMLPQMLQRGLNCPATSSCGRLFDAVAALMGLKTAIAYEGQAAIILEKEQDMNETGAYPLPITDSNCGTKSLLDTRVLFGAVLDDIMMGTPPACMARRFHLGIIQGFAEAAACFAAVLGIQEVALSGGVFQNLTIATELPAALKARGLRPLVHTQVPPNDACISLGQAVWGRTRLLLKG